MRFPENARTKCWEKLRLFQRNGRKAEDLDAPKDHVIFDVYHTYSIKVGAQDYTRQYTNHLVVKFVLEEVQETHVPDEFSAARRTQHHPLDHFIKTSNSSPLPL